jgi:glycosyltransferase involved in cell wall biosynthesis
MHPSELEAGHPNLTILEAAACGMPINGWIEMETDFYGIWRSPRDFFELLRGIDDITANYDSYSQQARKHAESLSWFNRTQDLLKIYERYTN